MIIILNFGVLILKLASLLKVGHIFFFFFYLDCINKRERERLSDEGSSGKGRERDAKRKGERENVQVTRHGFHTHTYKRKTLNNKRKRRRRGVKVVRKRIAFPLLNRQICRQQNSPDSGIFFISEEQYCFPKKIK